MRSDPRGKTHVLGGSHTQSLSKECDLADECEGKVVPNQRLTRRRQRRRTGNKPHCRIPNNCAQKKCQEANVKQERQGCTPGATDRGTARANQLAHADTRRQRRRKTPPKLNTHKHLAIYDALFGPRHARETPLSNNIRPRTQQGSASEHPTGRLPSDDASPDWSTHAHITTT